MDTSPFIGYEVRYSAMFAKPKVGVKLVGKVSRIQYDSSTEQIFMMSQVEGDIVCIVRSIDRSRFKVVEQAKRKQSESESEDSDEDSVFEDDEVREVSLEDTKKGRVLQAGSKVKLVIRDI